MLWNLTFCWLDHCLFNRFTRIHFDCYWSLIWRFYAGFSWYLNLTSDLSRSCLLNRNWNFNRISYIWPHFSLSWLDSNWLSSSHLWLCPSDLNWPWLFYSNGFSRSSDLNWSWLFDSDWLNWSSNFNWSRLFHSDWLSWSSDLNRSWLFDSSGLDRSRLFNSHDWFSGSIDLNRSWPLNKSWLYWSSDFNWSCWFNRPDNFNSFFIFDRPGYFYRSSSFDVPRRRDNTPNSTLPILNPLRFRSIHDRSSNSRGFYSGLLNNGSPLNNSFFRSTNSLNFSGSNIPNNLNIRCSNIRFFPLNPILNLWISIGLLIGCKLMIFNPTFNMINASMFKNATQPIRSSTIVDLLNIRIVFILSLPESYVIMVTDIPRNVRHITFRIMVRLSV